MVSLHSPSTDECDKVMTLLKIEKEHNNIRHNKIHLHNSSAESTLLTLTQIHQTGVSDLFIYDTSLTEECLYQICKMNYNNQLKVLSLENCNITNSGLQQLADSLKYNTTLTYLDVDNSPLITSSNGLCDVITSNTKLTYLYLVRTSLTANDIHQLLETITTSKTLQTLYLDEQKRAICQQYNNYELIKHKLSFEYSSSQI